ncbi:unnamed protein product [Protopolystoma xenopodis]|uniref:Uncharacterized protein n=1 Tax=Protopolystoma xenopodis TaxID=117903 RepID=A0A448X792_9PLAT|nr:unnamed protein product [Protopolystoma xenopodis]
MLEDGNSRPVEPVEPVQMAASTTPSLQIPVVTASGDRLPQETDMEGSANGLEAGRSKKIIEKLQENSNEGTVLESSGKLTGIMTVIDEIFV